MMLADCRVLGNAAAPYTLVELGNYGCPHCRASITQLNALLHDSRGRLKLIFSPAIRKPDIPFLQMCCAAEAGARQGKYQAMHEQLFAHQDALLNCKTAGAMREMIFQIAGSVGLHSAKFRGDLADPAVLQRVEQREWVALHYRFFPLPKYVFFTPHHAPMILQSTKQAVEWLRDPRHW